MDTFLDPWWLNSLLPAILQVITALIAMLAIKEWRNEYIGKNRYDLAEETLALFYGVRSAIKDIRYPLSLEGEGSTRPKEKNESIEETKKRNNANIPYERYKQRRDSFDRLNTIRFRFMARFGKKYEREFLEIVRIINKILMAAQKYHLRDDNEENDNINKLLSSIIYEKEVDDEINQRIDTTIKTIEGVCEKVKLK